jgi:hypothetical protein
MYNDHGKAFVIDNLKNQIHYISIDINFNEEILNIRYYLFEIVNGKIKQQLRSK